MNFWPALRDRGLQSVFGLADGLYRTVLGRRDLPPWSLRYYVGCAGDFEGTGAEFLAYLKLLTRLRPDDRVLDIGCGCGMLALQLRGVLGGDGRYAGMDISARAIDWCRRHITTTHPNFHFLHADLRNTRYNPAGALAAESYRFPFDAGDFDLILLKSVFTHLRAGAVAHYLSEVARLLSAGGRCLSTFFLLNPAQAELAAAGRNRIDFRFGGDGPDRYADEGVPERAVAYPEETLRQLVAGSGLRVESIHYGAWSGRRDGLSYQDLVVLNPGRA